MAGIPHPILLVNNGALVPAEADSSGNLLVAGSAGGGVLPVAINQTPDLESHISVMAWDPVNLVYVKLRGLPDGTLVVSGTSGGPVVTEPEDYILESDTSSDTVNYFGFAAPGAAPASAAWKIMQLNFDAGGNLLSKLYAGGSAAFTNVWNNRASYSYS